MDSGQFLFCHCMKIKIWLCRAESQVHQPNVTGAPVRILIKKKEHIFFSHDKAAFEAEDRHLVFQ